MSKNPIPLSAVSEKLQKHVDPKSPAPLRMMASRGMVPMGPKDMLTVLACLCFDADEKIAAGASKSLKELPARIVLGAVGEALHPQVLDQVARVLPLENEDPFEALLINAETPDETFSFLASQVSERLLNIIAENQVRILRYPPIAKSILDNPNVLKSTVDRLMDFAVRTGMDFRGLDAFDEAKSRILSAPPDAAESQRIQKVVEDSLPDEMLTEELEFEPGNPGEEAEKEVKKKTLLQRLIIMTPAQKVVLASKGNKTIRGALVKDRNKIVATAAIRNPGVSDSEVIGVAANRAVCDDVIRIICNNREWTRSYAVRKSLVENPKTPIVYSMRFMQLLRTPDLKGVATNKNIPGAVATNAKKMLRQRQGK